jgi:hypothetical protein
VTTLSTIYDDAEIAAIQVVRGAVTEETAPAGYSYSTAVNDLLVAVFEQHGPDGLTGVAVALGRLVSVALISPAKSFDELPAFLDEFEFHKIEQHQLERDDPESYAP